jgi:hypothetical protein
MVQENETLTLDLSRSSDPDGTPLSYRWTVDDRNVSSSPVLDLRLGRGVHRVYFVIKDGTGLTAADLVLVESIANGTAPDNDTQDRGGGGLDPVLFVPIAIILLTAVLTVVFMVLRGRSKAFEE